MNGNKLSQRRLKGHLIRKQFQHLHDFTVEFFPNRDVYEIRKKGRLLYTCYGYDQLTNIFQNVRQKLERH